MGSGIRKEPPSGWAAPGVFLGLSSASAGSILPDLHLVRLNPKLALNKDENRKQNNDDKDEQVIDIHDVLNFAGLYAFLDNCQG
jgi:hypothetical protein